MSAAARRTASLVVPLERASEYPRESVGGKARELGRLIALGFDVPPGFVVTTEAFRQFRQNDALPAELVERLTTDEARAFRSSGVAEDSAHASFAGQYETVLDVCGYEQAVEALRRCWGSADSRAVTEYVDTISHRSGAVAVIVQQMVQPDAAGVTFTANPVTGASELLIEATRGLGDALMDGAVDPERWVVRDADDIERLSGSSTILARADVETIARVCAEVEAAMGGPQDIEWALADGDVHLLQSRPITALPIEPEERPPDNQTWEREDGHFPDPVHPLFASWWLPAHARCFERVTARAGLPFDTLRSRLFGGRVYARVEPLGDGGRGRDDRGLPPAWLFWLLLRLVPAFRKRMKQAERAIADDLPMELIDAWEADGRQATAARTRELRAVDRAGLDDAALADHIEEVLEHTEAVGLDHFMLAIVSGAATLGKLGRLMQRHLGWNVLRTMDLLQGYGAASTEAGRALHALADAFRRDERGLQMLHEAPSQLPEWDGPAGEALRTFLDEYGHRPHGTSIAHPMWAEDPSPLLRVLRSQLRGTGEQVDPRAIAAEAEATARDAIDDPSTWSEVEEAIRRARRARPYQDETEGTSMEAFGVFRYAALEAARRLADRGLLGSVDDVWFLRWDELVGALRTGACDVDIARRRGEYRWALANRLPRVLGPRPQPPPTLPFPAAVDDFLGSIMWALTADMTAQTEGAEDADFTGLGCSPGQAEGPVRLIRNAGELDRLQPGDIMVCPGTNAAWSFAFPLLSGLITEVGGPLSHPATLTREYGIPGVLGVDGATTSLCDGDVVRIDGTTGAVHLVDRARSG